MADTVREHLDDSGRRALVAQWEAADAEAAAALLQKHGLTRSAFYSIRYRIQQADKKAAKEAKAKQKRFSPEGIEAIKKAQRERWARQKAAGIPHKMKRKGNSFRDAGTDEKRRLLAEHDALNPTDRRAWKAAHGLSAASDSALLTYYRQRFAKEPPVPSVALVKTNGNGHSKTPLELLAEYDALPKGTGQKEAWLNAHGVSRTWPSNTRQRYLKKEAPQPSQLPIPIAHLIPSAAPTPVVTLDDAIRAIEIRMDCWNEMLTLLRSMQRSGGGR